MSVKLKIGRAGSREFTLPPDVQTQTSAVLGIRGSGKTNTATVIVEELLDRGHQTVIIDPTDVWWGLKSSGDGKRAGYAVTVLGGAHGDLPLKATDGATVADFLVDHQGALLLSLRHLRKGDQRRLVTDFAEQLFHRKGEASKRTPLLVVIDECDAFIPQRVGSAEARMVGAIEDLVRRGRAAGLGVMLISQRAASVNKDVLTQLELLVAHRHVSPQDRKALDLWVQAHDAHGDRERFMGELASLPIGSAWFWSPGWLDVFARVGVRARRTFDSSATPKAGKRAPAPKHAAKVDLDALKKRLASTIEAAAANDPKALRQRIAQLERQLAKGANQVDEEMLRAAVQAAEFKTAATWRYRWEQWAARLMDLVEQGNKAIFSTPPKPRGGRQVAPRPPAPPTAPVAASELREGNGILRSSVKRRMLTALAQYPAGVERKRLAALVGTSPTNGNFGNRWAELVRGELAERVGNGTLAITDQGLTDLGAFTPLPTGPALVEHWRRRMGGGIKGRLFDAIVGVWPDTITRIELAEACETTATNGNFGNRLGELVRVGIVERDGGGLRAAEELMA